MIFDMIIKPLKISSKFVAFVNDIDLKKKLKKSEITNIQENIDTYGVLVFRNQSLSDDEQVNFSECFGNIEHSGEKIEYNKR